MSSLITFTGDKRLIRTFDDLPKRLQKSTLSKSVRSAARRLLSLAASLAPVKSGILRKNLKVRMMKKRARGEIAFVVRTGSLDEMGVSSDGVTYYPAIQEYGSSNRNIKALRYMKMAKEAFRPRYIQLVTSELRKFISTARP